MGEYGEKKQENGNYRGALQVRVLAMQVRPEFKLQKR